MLVHRMNINTISGFEMVVSKYTVLREVPVVPSVRIPYTQIKTRSYAPDVTYLA
jgi:hypothetical protein